MRRTRTFTATAGRDKGKRYLITEMPADQAERWATRALLALANGGTQLPDGVLDAGLAGFASMAGVFVMSIRSLNGLRYADVEPLMNEMMDCVQYLPSGANPANPLPPQALFSGENSQIEEVQTRMALRGEVLQVHTDFSLAGVLSSFRPSSAADPEPSAL